MKLQKKTMFPPVYFVMHSTRRPKVKARRSKEMDFLSDVDIMDVVLGEESSNTIEQ